MAYIHIFMLLEIVAIWFNLIALHKIEMRKSEEVVVINGN